MPGVTKQRISEAREADLFSYLQIYESGVLKRDGPNFRHREHDSLVYDSAKRYWYWNSRGRKINALDYLIEIRGYTLVDAVNRLTDGDCQSHVPAQKAAVKPISPKEQGPKILYLPWARKCSTLLVSYLQHRGISSEVISQCLKLGLMYEGRYMENAVCVFVGKDETGKARFACMRGIGTELKKDTRGSDKRFGFCYPPQKPESRQLSVFEAPLDVLSHATLQELEGWEFNGYRLSLGGTSQTALISFLERHPEIRRVTLHMDNDLAGLVNARKIKAMLIQDQRFKHIRVGINPPRTGKDYNEKLLFIREQMKDQMQPCRQKQAAISI